jgi:4-carboxymuconolactone decarboxylase
LTTSTYVSTAGRAVAFPSVPAQLFADGERRNVPDGATFEPGCWAYTIREPPGVAGAITAWNASGIEEPMMDDELYEKGIEIREEMLGPEHGRAKVESQPDFTREFEELVTRYCFGSVWGREGISRGTRSMLTIAMLVALGRAQEIQWHVKGAINNGVSKDELREVLMHSAIYCGIPAAVDGFRNASAVLAELGLE